MLHTSAECHIQVAIVSLGTFHCVDIYGTFYKASNLSRTCYDSDWTLEAATALFGIVMLSLGCTTFIAAPGGISNWHSSVHLPRSHKVWTCLRSGMTRSLNGCRNKHKLYSDEKLLARFGVLYKRYEPEYYCATLMLDKLVLTTLCSQIGSSRRLSESWCSVRCVCLYMRALLNNWFFV